MTRLMERAYQRGAELVVFPELALTTFFPRHYHEDIAEADHWFEPSMPSNETAPLFDAARRFGIGFHVGYAELADEADERGRVLPECVLCGGDGEGGHRGRQRAVRPFHHRQPAGRDPGAGDELG